MLDIIKFLFHNTIQYNTTNSIKALKPGSWTYRLGEFADEINEYELEKLEIITHTVFQSRTHTISSFIPLSPPFSDVHSLSPFLSLTFRLFPLRFAT